MNRVRRSCRACIAPRDTLCTSHHYHDNILGHKYNLQSTCSRPLLCCCERDSSDDPSQGNPCTCWPDKIHNMLFDRSAWPGTTQSSRRDKKNTRVSRNVREALTRPCAIAPRAGRIFDHKASCVALATKLVASNSTRRRTGSMDLVVKRALETSTCI